MGWVRIKETNAQLNLVINHNQPIDSLHHDGPTKRVTRAYHLGPTRWFLLTLQATASLVMLLLNNHIYFFSFHKMINKNKKIYCITRLILLENIKFTPCNFEICERSFHDLNYLTKSFSIFFFFFYTFRLKRTNLKFYTLVWQFKYAFVFTLKSQLMILLKSYFVYTNLQWHQQPCIYSSLRLAGCSK